MSCTGKEMHLYKNIKKQMVSIRHLQKPTGESMLQILEERREAKKHMKT